MVRQNYFVFIEMVQSLNLPDSAFISLVTKACLISDQTKKFGVCQVIGILLVMKVRAILPLMECCKCNVYTITVITLNTLQI